MEDIEQIVHQLNQGKSLRKLASELGKNHGNLSKSLKRRGYKLIENQWVQEPVVKPVKSEPLKIHKVSKVDSHEQHTKPESDSPTFHTHGENIPREIHTTPKPIHTDFTPQEIATLKQMIQAWNKESHDPLFDRAAALPRGEKKRRTIVIGEETSNKFDEFAKRFPAITLSDLLEIAMIDLLTKYK